jgi:hypothetical protein
MRTSSSDKTLRNYSSKKPAFLIQGSLLDPPIKKKPALDESAIPGPIQMVDASGYRQIFLTIACGFMSSKVIGSDEEMRSRRCPN